MTDFCAQELRASRERVGLSQAKLAELTGIPQYVLSGIERGAASMSDEIRRQVEQVLSSSNLIAATRDRKKRYHHHHEYNTVIHDSSRIAKYNATPENVDFKRELRDFEYQRAASKHRGPTAVSLFSGCGGFSLGAAWAGFNVVGFAEIDDGLREIYRLNFPTSQLLGTDLTKIEDGALRSFSEKFGEIDIILGGPPCQGFSLSGKRDECDPRNTLFKHYLRFVDALRSKVAILENVRVLTSMRSATGKMVKDEIEQTFREHGYTVRHFEINAKSYGVPQHRERVIFIAVRHDIARPPSLPSPSHGSATELFDEIKRYRTFADACSDLTFIESGESSSDPLHKAVHHPSHVINWLWDVPEGFSAHDNEDPAKRPPSGYNTTYKRQVWSEPGGTVQTTFGMISGCRNVHPICTRSLTIREAARLQSFPDTYRFCGTLGTIQTGIGNAVPPLLAYVIAKHVACTYLDFVEISSL